HTRFSRDWSSDVCSSDLAELPKHRIGQKRLAATFLVLRPRPPSELVRCHGFLWSRSQYGEGGQQGRGCTDHRNWLVSTHSGPRKIGRASCRERVEWVEGG